MIPEPSWFRFEPIQYAESYGELEGSSWRLDASAFGWVAVSLQDGAKVGLVCLLLLGPELHVVHIATLSAHRRRGVARALMQKGMIYGREKGASVIVLEVRSSNLPAKRLYESLGFVSVRRRSRYYADGEDAVEMHFALANNLPP